MRSAFPDNPQIVDQGSTLVEFGLMAIAANMKLVAKLFPAEQARRVKGYVVYFAMDKDPELAVMAHVKINEYISAWDDGERDSPLGGAPGMTRLLFKELGCSSHGQILPDGIPVTAIILDTSQLLLQHLSRTWKNILEKGYTLVE